MPIDFGWQEKYSVQVKEIDEQHKQLISLIARLLEAIRTHSVRADLGKILEELTAYAGYHFATEEKYFDAFNYPLKDEHVEEHRKFAAQIADYQRRYEDNKIEISYELIDFLEDWLLDHFIETDQKYVKCFKEHGLK